MTTIETEAGAAEVINARRTESLDAPHILKLVQPWTEQLFGRINIVNVIEKAVLAVTLSNENEDIMAHAAFFDYPNLKDVDEADWENWMRKFYVSQQCTPLNSLFMHYFVAQSEYAQGCAREIVRTAFNAVPDLHYIFLVVPVGIFPDASIASIFRPMDKPEGSTGPTNKCALFVCGRSEHVPVLHIRDARVEDHDDLTPIFNRQSDMLKATYGEYFLAELIEVEGSAVGFLSISNDVNFPMLNECFELGPFHGLRKPHPDDHTTPPPTPESTPVPSKDEVDEEKAAAAPEEVKKEETEAPPAKAEGAEAKSPKEGAGSETAGSRPESQASQKEGQGQEGGPPVVKKLSDAHMGETQAPLVTDPSSPRSAQDLASEASEELGKVSRQTSMSTPKPLEPTFAKRFVPEYYGIHNAFSIQLFCVDERYEMRSIDFLPKAFSMFPDRDFCIITLPHLVPEFPLIQSFVRVTPRCPSTLPQELYIFHRSGLLRNFVVRPACTSDYSSVEKLVKTIQLNENLLADLTQYNKARRDADGTEIQAFVAECQRQIVGVAIIRREEDIEYIRSHYNIEDFIYYNHHRREDHGHLHHLEILRQGHKTCLYYPLYPVYSSKETLSQHSLACSLSVMVPVRARRQIIYPVEQLGINAPSERVLVEREAYALSHLNKKLTLEPKVTINARIVVVGASDVGLSFLETLSYCPHLRFNNLTLISPHGLPGEMQYDELRDEMLPTSHFYSREEYARVSFRTSVNVVYGKMTALNRQAKVVIVNGEYQVPYDHLVLCNGQQFQVPAPTLADPEAGDTNENLPNHPDNRLLEEPPRNLYLVNDEYDAAVALYKAQTLMMRGTAPIIVYGSNLNAYCCIQALMTLGIQGSVIVLVEPPVQEPVFEDAEVTKAVKNALTSEGVTVYSGYYLARWNDGVEVPTEITSASFTSNDQPLRLECQAFFAFYKKGVDIHAFKAINDSYLVYDGKLVIDATFHTNDVTIRGAGPLTKFQRRYHADRWTHAIFSSKEVGIAFPLAVARNRHRSGQVETEMKESNQKRSRVQPETKSCATK
ncbi:hypothetical protein BaRGS_00001745 [Batillaria attramentaria]|uniref:Cilia- and flagella-associated protein 61 N-terminal domain-containing protein n=1 Tax=Batillaria attramentaria TaxID=370345 RepID=A0ABD0M4Y4_9CAEN